MKNKCNKCNHYKPVEIFYLGISYKHKCGVGKYYRINENIEKNTENSLQTNGEICFSDRNLESFWRNKWICIRKSSFFIEKVLPNILAITAIAISIFAYYKPENSEHKLPASNGEKVTDSKPIHNPIIDITNDSALINQAQPVIEAMPKKVDNASRLNRDVKNVTGK